MQPSGKPDNTAVETEPVAPSSRRSNPNRWPDFFVIGAAKSGTTTMHSYLALHPSLWMSEVKEPRFFDPTAIPEMRDPANYHKLFEGASEQQLCGESSPFYSMWPTVPDVPRSIHAVVPRARFIYLLREPVARCYSHYVFNHSRRRFRNQPFRMSFQEYLEFEPMIMQAGDYASQIQRYLEYFPKESFLLLPFERFVKEPAWALREAFKFLGVEDLSESIADEPIHDNSIGEFNALMRRQRVLSPFHRVPGLRFLYRRFSPAWRAKSIALIESSFLGRRDKRKFAPPPLLPADRERLEKRFAASTEYLQREFGFDVGLWARKPG